MCVPLWQRENDENPLLNEILLKITLQDPSSRNNHAKPIYPVCIDKMKEEIEELKNELRILSANVLQQAAEIDSLRKTAIRLQEEKKTQAEYFADAITQAEKACSRLEDRLRQQEFRAEKFMSSDFAIQKLTGHPSYTVMRFIFEHIMWGDDEKCMNRLDIQNDRIDESYPDRSRGGEKLLLHDYFNQFFLMLFKLRTGMNEEVLAAIYGISQPTVSRYYNCWIRVAADRFKAFFRQWPYITRVPLPVSTKVQSHFPKISSIIDCFEIRIEKPSNPDAARKCYSNYKRGYTVKCLVGVETDGNCCFRSHIYQGAISDVAIVRQSGFLDKLQIGDVVLADRGFQMADEAADRGVKWVVPPSVNKAAGMSREDLSDTCVTARARILVERFIGRAKKFHQLDGPLRIDDLTRLDFELTVVTNLCRFLPLLIRDLDFLDEQAPAADLECLFEDYGYENLLEKCFNFDA